MKAFVDGIGLRVGHCGGGILDPIDGKDMLKGVGYKLVASVVDATEWARVASEPFVVKFHGNMRRGFVVNAEDFGQGSHWVNTGESKEFKVASVDCDGPGPDKINSYFIPRLCCKIFGWKFTARDARQFAALTSVAGLNKGVALGAELRGVEMRGNCLVKALCT